MAVGIVVVSHSIRLAEAAVELAMQMVHGDRPPVALAAGTADGGLGTDATAVLAAIEEADQGDGVAVFVDIGSALMSAEFGVELYGRPEADVRILAAPFVEGLLAGVVQASGGAGLDDVAREALAALGGLERAALHSQLAAAVQVVLHCHRSADGSRSLAEIAVLERNVRGEVEVVPAWTPCGRWGPGADRLRTLVDGSRR